MNLLRALSTVSGMTLASRITGLVRESLKAVLFGAGSDMDAFEAAFRLPNILRRMFAEGAFSQAFVPILAEYRRQRGAEETRALVGKVGTLLAVALLVVSVAGVLAAPWLVYLLAAGFAKTPGKVELTAELIRIVFPYILFVSLVSLAGGVLNVHRRFAIPAFTPVLLNLAVIAAAIWLAPHVDPPVLALAWGVAAGGVAQLALQIRPLAKLAMLPRPSFAWRDPGVSRVLLAMGPALLGVSAAQISVLLNTQWAAWLGDGRIAWITYADRLMEFPSALLGVALGTVLLPTLARHHADNDPARYSDLLDWGLRLALLLALPAALALWLLAVPLIATLYQYGRFTPADVYQVRLALIGYAAGLTALILVKILAPGFYARQNLRTPVKIAVFTVLVTQAFALLLMWPLGHAGLTLATSIGACVNAGLLFAFLVRRGHYRPRDGWTAFAGRLVVALAVLAAVLAATAGPASVWVDAPLWSRVARLALIVAAGAAAYFGSLWLLGFRLADFSRRDFDAVPDPAAPPES
ncbi:MAG: murein biosynthesis integral membrane protein MurJ [Betaproteobacteria bacterium]|nr:murein biosynthesis integral membrane protein MurJ [Betaproteobacteria bacterium]MDH5287594.1 murein biosynthesis integral membrane protein MurJ [Betaproteobacteria bacterium]